ncbi:MAG: helix-turn-helix domain-containing protein, partial [Anaerolineales bacterium]|nr:helix-turn-helix domain-containing protein [Anaerolineales bacterium]
MATFSELLTEYMTRTGISDSELARHLGISRQTIFRWKEGLTARPRVREDVLKCAERLRLSPPERDNLLLAAGFAPEQISSAPDNSLVAPDANALVAVEPQVIHIPSNPPMPKRTRRWLGFLVLALVVAAIVGLLLAVPSTAQNLIAWISPPTPTLVPSPTPTPLPPELVIAMARLNSRGGQAPAYDVTARLRQTLEREIEREKLV